MKICVLIIIECNENQSLSIQLLRSARIKNRTTCKYSAEWDVHIWNQGKRIDVGHYVEKRDESILFVL